MLATMTRKLHAEAGRVAHAETPNQLARRLGISIHSILALIKSGELRAVNWARVGSTRPRWRITPGALADFEARRSSKPTPPTERKKKPKKDPSFVEYY
jgi:hypothetical protein